MRFLEPNGIVILGAGLAWGILGRDLRRNMVMLATGATVFLIGYLLETRVGLRR